MIDLFKNNETNVALFLHDTLNLIKTMFTERDGLVNSRFTDQQSVTR